LIVAVGVSNFAHAAHSAHLSGEGQRVDGDFFERGV
jgi:hypothetical protein